jgi:phosphatidylinositol glycan class N
VRTSSPPCRQLILLSYDWLALRIIVVLGYLGWMAAAGTFVLRHYGSARLPPSPPSATAAYSGCVAVFAALAGKFALERSPVTFYLYAAFGTLFWALVLRDPVPLSSAARRVLARPAELLAALVVLGTLELAVLGYFHRQAWTAGFVLLGCVAPLWSTSAAFRAQPENRKLAAAWAVSCLVTGIFPLLPVEKGESLVTVCVVAFWSYGKAANARTVPPARCSSFSREQLARSTRRSTRRLCRRGDSRATPRGSNWPERRRNGSTCPAS